MGNQVYNISNFVWYPLAFQVNNSCSIGKYRLYGGIYNDIIAFFLSVSLPACLATGRPP